ncbi:MAG: ABC transporter permease [Chitinophagaceae bacterium]
MFKNYLLLAWRNLKKNKVFSLINILGLTIGITVCLMIFIFIRNEFSVDSFHIKRDNIYRVMRSFDPSKPKVPYLSGPYATALKNDFTGEINEFVRVMATNGLVSSGNISFNEKKLYIADPGFFTIFSFPLIKGNPSSVLQEPGSVVLTQTTARKYFGDADPIGKILQLEQERELRVTGIAKDPPNNSHLNFDLVVPLSIYYQEPWFKVWNNNNLFTYVLLDKNVSCSKLEQRFPSFMQKYMGKEMAQTGNKFDLTLSPLTEIYFEPASAFDNVKHGDKKVVYIFLSVAVLILIIACINFTNLSTIRALERSKEVGLRKVMGALRGHLVGQFIGESILLTTISCMLAVALLQPALPLFDQLLGYELNVSWTTPAIYLFLASVIVVVGILSGGYPAFLLSSFSPIQALKAKIKTGKGSSWFRQGLVVLQFGISVFLVIATIIIMNQMSYVKNKELGYSEEQTVVIPIDNNDFYNNCVSFKRQLQQRGEISSVSLMSGEPGGFHDGHSFEVEGRPTPWNARTEFCDFEFARTLGLKIIAGRDFSPQFPTDSTDAVMINHTAAKQLGFTPDQAVGKWIKNNFRDSTSKRRIVGVLEDYNFLSLKELMEPLVITPGNDLRVALIKTKSAQLEPALAAIKKIYRNVAPANPLEYTFLDQKFDILYRNDIRQQKVFSIFSALAIFIACLGLFGLASFTASKRIREIGVRKVLGSTTTNIVMLLYRDLLKPVLLATILAIPAGYYVMEKWLQNFAYHTPMHWWIFALAGCLTIVTSLITVSFRAINAALANPVNSLRAD